MRSAGGDGNVSNAVSGALSGEDGGRFSITHPLPGSSLSARPASSEDGTVMVGRGCTVPQRLDAHEEFKKVRSEVDMMARGGFSFAPWVDGQVRRILASRTGFSFYCMQSIISCRRGRCGAPSTALFPIPVPSLKVWCSARSRGQKARKLQACYKLLHLVVMALNFEYLGHPLGSLDLLRRPPALHHTKVYARLLGFIRACATIENISFLGCGRKSSQFSARVNELLGALAMSGPSSVFGYGGTLSTAVPLDNEVSEELVPYRSLDPGRLKLSGSGQWQCDRFMGDLFKMVFREPRVNRFSLDPPAELLDNFFHDDAAKVLDLCRVWDARGLLTLCPKEELKNDLQLASRIFNCRKSALVDRQIGDRRPANAVEGRLSGQSRWLPSGPTILQLSTRRYQEVLVGSITDRKDFYHQMATTWERSTTNFLLPSFRAKEFEGLSAYLQLCRDFGKKRRRGREVAGDQLVGGFDGFRPTGLLVDDDTEVVPCFSSVLQGDHLGVELASEAHAGMLIEAGLLDDASRLRADKALVSDDVVQGLYIDDFFAISREPLDFLAASERASKSGDIFLRAKAAYKSEGVLGSEEKDVIEQPCFRVVGAEVDSREAVVLDGLVGCGLPVEKRLSLATIASAVSTLGYTTDALHSSLIGSLVSMMMFRRVAMSSLQEVFQVIPHDELDTENPRLRHLSRRAAQELAIVAALAPVLASNLAAPFSGHIYATDASMDKGGVTVASVSPGVSSFLWRDADKKGCNARLESRIGAFLSRYDPMHESEATVFHEGEDADDEAVPRPLGLRFDFIEICGGSGVVTIELCRLGRVCGPVLDLSYSGQYDLTDHDVLAWCIFTLEAGRLRSFLVAPPCTTFSPAAFPPLRSYQKPEGFDPGHPRVQLGNRLAFAALCLLFVALRLRIFGMGEQPRRSKMRWLKMWQRLLALGAVETWTASCSFGSPHMKEFVFISAWMDASSIHHPCSKDHTHIPIQGRFTKPSAVYTPGLALALAKLFKQRLDSQDEALNFFDLKVDGLEDQASNDLALSLRWKVDSSWRWKGRSHINLLETAATLKLYRDVAIKEGDVRFVYLSDSHVARSSLARGRTSSLALRSLLKKSSSICIGYGLYPAGRFAPTRWNPSDHPTRDTSLPDPVPSSLVELCCPAALSWICSLPRQRRWAANWIRLVLLISPGYLEFVASTEACRRHAYHWISPADFPLDFDATLGFPGEGPLVLLLCLLIAARGGTRWGGSFLGWIIIAPSSHGMPLEASSAGDELRQRARQGIVLGTGRPVLESTKAARDDLFAAFSGWLSEKGLDYQSIFGGSPFDLDRINQVLVDYGRALFEAGKPYYHYSETLNSVTSRKPLLRRSIGVAWDLAFLWGSHEPAEHHVAVPHQILLAILSVCILWGWLREAASFALAFGALLRIGEIVGASRGDLLLPGDVNYTVKHILLKIREPKTRHRAARHQVGKMEQPDLILVIQMGFGALKKHERLWPSTAATLRHRLDRVLKRLSLPWGVVRL